MATRKLLKDGTFAGGANLTDGFLEKKLNEALKQGNYVPNAVGANPTKAEFDALLTQLRNAGVLKTS